MPTGKLPCFAHSHDAHVPTRRCLLPTPKHPEAIAFLSRAESTQPTAVRWAGKRTLQAAVTRRRNRDAQKQRTSPSACARLRSLIAALACSGDWNMAPNRPGTCERLKTASAAT